VQLAHTNPIPLDFLYIWTGLFFFTLESGGRAAYMETHSKSFNRPASLPTLLPKGQMTKPMGRRDMVLLVGPSLGPNDGQVIT
jgi:hypothetical protein